MKLNPLLSILLVSEVIAGTSGTRVNEVSSGIAKITPGNTSHSMHREPIDQAVSSFAPSSTVDVPAYGKLSTASTSSATSTHTPDSMYSLYKYYGRNMLNELGRDGRQCSLKNVRERKGWSRMDNDEQLEFLEAINCVIKAPHAGGDAKYLWDAFVEAHMITGYEHEFTGLHLHWHRIFLHLFEEIGLRQQCNYGGSLPYWDFSEHSNDIEADPALAATGSNGEKLDHGPTYVNYLGRAFTVPAGSGGGCVMNATTKDEKARFGKAVAYEKNVTHPSIYPLPQFPDGKLEYGYTTPNERCVTRDLNAWFGPILNVSHVEYDLDTESFATLLQRLNGETKNYPYIANLMNTIRFAVGGLQFDPYAGVADPIWFLTAANFDRLWAIWQGQNLTARINQTGGPVAPYDWSGPVQVNLNTSLQFPGLQPVDGGDYYVSNATSTIDGPLCYIYDGTY